MHGLEDVADLFHRVGAPLPDHILQLQVFLGEHEHNFFSYLRVDWDPICSRFLHYLPLVKLFQNEASLIDERQNKLSSEPYIDLFVALTLDAVSSLAFLELDDERSHFS